MSRRLMKGSVVLLALFSFISFSTARIVFEHLKKNDYGESLQVRTFSTNSVDFYFYEISKEPFGTALLKNPFNAWGYGKNLNPSIELFGKPSDKGRYKDQYESRALFSFTIQEKKIVEPKQPFFLVSEEKPLKACVFNEKKNGYDVLDFKKSLLGYCKANHLDEQSLNLIDETIFLGDIYVGENNIIGFGAVEKEISGKTYFEIIYWRVAITPTPEKLINTKFELKFKPRANCVAEFFKNIRKAISWEILFGEGMLLDRLISTGKFKSNL